MSTPAGWYPQPDGQQRYGMANSGLRTSRQALRRRSRPPLLVADRLDHGPRTSPSTG